MCASLEKWGRVCSLAVLDRVNGLSETSVLGSSDGHGNQQLVQRQCFRACIHSFGLLRQGAFALLKKIEFPKAKGGSRTFFFPSHLCVLHAEAMRPVIGLQ